MTNKEIISLIESGEIEKYGTGLIRIRVLLKSYPEIGFDFEEVNNGILVTYTKTTAHKTAHKGTKEKIIDLLKENPYYTKEDLMNALNKADDTIKEHLANLKKEGRIARRGSRKDGYSEVLE